MRKLRDVSVVFFGMIIESLLRFIDKIRPLDFSNVLGGHVR